jgi:cholesterol oxidase
MSSALDFDVLVIGSGFGGGVSALRLTEKSHRVGVLEAGRRFTADDFPRTNWDLRNYLWAPRLGLRGIQRMTLLSDVLVISGSGVGGGSLVYANTLYRPHDAFYVDPQWADITDWRTELAPHYSRAERMLGVTTAEADGPADAVLRSVAAAMGVEDSFTATPVGVFLGEPGRTVPDPYFGGAGPDRTGCLRCGACMTGCRHGAKNSIDLNYLYLAERNGARVFPEHEVVDLERFADGFVVTTTRPGSSPKRHRRAFTAGQVVFAAGALGTTRLLLRLAGMGRLPHVSPRLGRTVRTNSEAIIGATARSTQVDYSSGVAISSSIHTADGTHIESVRYGKGSSAMGLLATVMVDGGGGIPRVVRFALTVFRHPVSFVRSLSVRRWAERSVILLVMQSADNSIRLRLKGGRLSSEHDDGQPPPTYIPAGNRAARLAATHMGGTPMSALNEVLFDTPTTAHILGGACVGADPTTGVVDAYHRMFGEPGLHVIDGAAVGANLGVNPSLSIAAMAERAMSMWPNSGASDGRPPLGEPYRQMAPVAPAHPIVPDSGAAPI